MEHKRILFTTPTYPYPTLPGNEGVTDWGLQRLTKGDGIFSFTSHTHCYANHILAQNINAPSVILEYPRWNDFTGEVDKGYEIIGISAFPIHLDNVLKMCEYVRSRSPQTVIMLGSYAAQAFAATYDQDTQKRYVDHVVLGDGVRFLREYLGEEPDRPIEQKMMPKNGCNVPFMSKHPNGNTGLFVTGLGCVGGCDFCSTTAMFGKKRIEMLAPETLVEHIELYHRHCPEVDLIILIEEDHFRFPEYLHTIREFWCKSPHIVENHDLLLFGSVDNIGKFALKYGWDALAELGAGVIFVGVESKFAGEHGYEKRGEIDAREVFDNLHRMGIRTIGAWICGWDFHNHGNVYEDLNYFVSLKPTYQQLTRLSAFPGTELWSKMKEEGRIKDVPWEDVHFWCSNLKNAVLEPHETLNITEYGYELLYRTWGPSALRRLDVSLNGYEYCMQSSNPLMREHKALFFKRQSAYAWLILRGLDRFAPNGVVRRRGRAADQRYRRVIGEPTRFMRIVAWIVERKLKKLYKKEMFDPSNRYPREEPFARYYFDKNESSNSIKSYRTEFSRRSFKLWKEMTASDLEYALYALLARALRLVSLRKWDKDIDGYIEKKLSTRSSVAL